MGPGVSSRIPEDSLAIFWASGFIWCEALSPGVPKPFPTTSDATLPDDAFGNHISTHSGCAGRLFTITSLH